ncbi:response regulator [Pseudomonas sp. IC_126]|uniref:hybrid sensor histidine kinase/response regulator n=1 Tax=Pseudomonas sp. IC_126 TaxID=2547400 RepID=UPI00103FAC37|nr:ATP-binding protein [Pseudomonas sp. IC_126]TCD18758.1 response regulator [Pseudomonas sp. IC_126]
MSIRARLVWLVVAVIAPSLAFALYATYSVYQSQSFRVAQSMEGTTRAVAQAVDRELARYGAIVSTVAANPSLAQGDLRTFHARLQRTALPLGTGVTVFDPDGIPLINTEYPYDRPLPMPPSIPSVASQGARTLEVSPLYRDPLDRTHSIALHQPVLRDGKIAYYLSMEFPTAGLRAMLSAQELPEKWLGVLLDRDLNIVARTRDDQAHVGERASPEFQRQLQAQASRSGSLESVTRDGEDVVTFYSRAESSHWTVLIAIPKQELLASVFAPIGTAVLGIALVLALAVALAIAVGRTITRPLALLDRAAEALARGEVIGAAATGMPETDRSARVFAQASLTINRANQDMTERVAEAVAQAERSHQALLQGQKLEALGRLTGGIAHDFNNLLQSMTVGLQLADMLSTHPRAKRAIEACQRSAQRGTQLTRKLMTFSRGRTSEAKRVDLRSLILGMRELLHGALPSRVELNLDLPEGNWPIVVDPLQCELAILNMAINARDAMPDGGTLDIRLSRVDLGPQDERGLASGAYLHLIVADTGYGMSKEIQARAFEPFFTTKAVGEGTGLGLAQVYGFAHHSSGAVSIDSEVDNGTRIALVLPCANKTAEPVTVKSQAAMPLTGTARVLLVDDDEEVRDVVAPMLEELGYAVDVAGNAEMALARLAASDQPTVDLLFSDVVMPGDLDGVGLAELARSRYPDLRIVLATGYTERIPTEHGMRILTKPFSIETLSAAVHDALGLRSAGLTP